MESEMVTVTVKKEEEEEEDDSSQQPAAVEDDCSQQHYLIPGYNMIFIKEEAYGSKVPARSDIRSCFTHGPEYVLYNPQFSSWNSRGNSHL
ncbi:uncharacterized protein LOC111060704 isoform X2 [Nilaparvata lugens]|uniref:uncharacterized protein LOC111060704 isoform X2 n=1 Tax=Nilaparvata lugens TaxID=108931 RepID=UPI00193D64EB|nr:uncharacterized protein LOC111060704 isoform X2 [Nilaparvata lugens]